MQQQVVVGIGLGQERAAVGEKAGQVGDVDKTRRDDDGDLGTSLADPAARPKPFISPGMLTSVSMMSNCSPAATNA